MVPVGIQLGDFLMNLMAYLIFMSTKRSGMALITPKFPYTLDRGAQKMKTGDQDGHWRHIRDT